MLSVGIIGCGKIAQVRHIPEYLNQKGVQIAGLYDVNQERAEQLAEKYHTKAYATCQELLEDPEIEAVSVCTANTTHAQIAVQAMRAGKHVLCEKPMATTLEDCKQMVRVAGEENRFLMIAQNQRLTKAHLRAKQMIESGEIGKVLTFRTTFGHGGPEAWSVDTGDQLWFFDNTKAAMGAMADLGVHKVDLIQYLTSAKVEAVTAKIVTLDKKTSDGNFIGVDDNAICLYELSGGIMGTMTASWTYYGAEDNSTILYGTEGILKIYDDPAYALKLIKKDGTEVLYDEEPMQTNECQTDTGIIEMFVRGIMENRQPEISGESVLHTMRSVFAAEKSSREGRRISLDEEE